jgi:hypothetical protein
LALKILRRRVVRENCFGFEDPEEKGSQIS